MSAGANDGTYAGLGVNQSGGGGGGLHSLVHTLREKLGSHCAQLIPGVATTTAAIGNNATATLAARRRNNLVTQASRDRPVSDIGLLEPMPSTPQRHQVRAGVTGIQNRFTCAYDLAKIPATLF
jgi:hypothetical protein